MSQPVSPVAGTVVAPRSLLAASGSPAIARSVQGQDAAAATADVTPKPSNTAANPATPAAVTPAHAPMPASTDPGVPLETAPTVITGTTVAPAPVASTAFTKPATNTHLGVPSAFPARPSPAGSIGGAVSALIVVVALILALAWLAKRMPVLGGGTGSNPALRIVGSLALGPRERVVVVAVGDTQLLVGVGVGGTRVLHTLAEPLTTPAAAPPAFAQLLAQHFGKKA